MVMVSEPRTKLAYTTNIGLNPNREKKRESCPVLNKNRQGKVYAGNIGIFQQTKDEMDREAKGKRGRKAREGRR